MGEPIMDNNQENRVDGSQSSSACSDHNGSCNGLSDSKASIVLNISKPPDLDYLAQLLKDKKQLAAFSNIFGHVERLLDDEINKVRIALFQCKFTREPLILPDQVGEVVMKQEKIFVPVKSHPEYNFVGRILGPRGMTAKQLESETGCKIMVRGKGSIRDKKKEELNKGKANWEHLQEELHVLIQSEDTPNRNEIKIKRAIEEVKKLLVPSPEGEDDLKKKQLMELAIINGTYRNGATAGPQNCQSQASVAALGQFAAAAAAAAAVNNGNKQNHAFLNYDQRLLASNGFAFPMSTGVFPNGVSPAANCMPSMRSPALAGAPLIMQQQTQNSNQQQINGSSGRGSTVPNGMLGTNGQSQNVNQANAAAAQLAAMAQAQVALQMQISAANSQMLAGQSHSSFGQISSQAATNNANGNVTPNHQAAIDYQIMLNAAQCDPNSLLQFQQQQIQQQQQLQQQQMAAFMHQASSVAAGSNAICTPTFVSADPTNAAAVAAAAAAAVGGFSAQAFNIGSNTAGSILTQQRRFLGQSREHPYGKREGS